MREGEAPATESEGTKKNLTHPMAINLLGIPYLIGKIKFKLFCFMARTG